MQGETGLTIEAEDDVLGTLTKLTEREENDCDSDDLEALEDAAELEQANEEELNRIVDEAGLIYPPEKVDDLLEELKQDGLVNFVQVHVVGKSEATIKALFIALGVLLPKDMRESSMTPGYLVSILKTILARHLRQRRKLEQYNTIEDAIRLIGESKRIVVLSGAGISTSVGIPDFRSQNGIYAQLQREGKYDLADPQDMFDKDFFLQDPSCFYSFARSIYPSNFIPSPCHRFIKLLENRNVLLRNYTQNIDTLEQAAGIENVFYCHGSFSKAQCVTPGCGLTVDGSAIKNDIFAQRIPYCPRCEEAKQVSKKVPKSTPKHKSFRDWEQDDDDEDDDDDNGMKGLGVMKPTIVFFGEKLSAEYDKFLLSDRSKVDLLIVMGTSLKVAPVSDLIGHIPHHTPVILINKTPVLHMGTLDIQLLGEADEIVEYICNRLGWSLPSPQPNKDVVGEKSVAEEVDISGVPNEKQDNQAKRVGDTHYWLFPGAEADDLYTFLKRQDDSDSESSEEEVPTDGVAGQGEMNVTLQGTKRPSSADDQQRQDSSKHQRHL